MQVCSIVDTGERVRNVRLEALAAGVLVGGFDLDTDFLMGLPVCSLAISGAIEDFGAVCTAL